VKTPLLGSEERSRRLAAIGLAVAAFALFSVNDALIKHLAARYPLPQMVFFNALFALIPIVAFGLWRSGRQGLATRRPVVQVFRGFLGLSIAFGAFFAFTRMALADVYAILFAAPLIIAALSALFFKEKLDAPGWGAIVVGFGGVLMMLHPSGDSFNEGAFAALWASVAFSLSALIVRHWGRGEPPASFPFYGCLVGAAVMGVFLPWWWTPPQPADFALIAGCGVVAGCGLCCMLNAFRLAPPPVIAPFQYTQMLWGVLFGAVFFGDFPDADLLFGAGVVAAAGLFVLHRERRRR
jgi:drug/metabolite transporter (DMT)-like permease